MHLNGGGATSPRRAQPVGSPRWLILCCACCPASRIRSATQSSTSLSPPISKALSTFGRRTKGSCHIMPAPAWRRQTGSSLAHGLLVSANSSPRALTACGAFCLQVWIPQAAEIQVLPRHRPFQLRAGRQCRDWHSVADSDPFYRARDCSAVTTDWLLLPCCVANACGGLRARFAGQGSAVGRVLFAKRAALGYHGV